MHGMQTIVTNVRGVCPQSVCHECTERPHTVKPTRDCFTVPGHSVQLLPNHFGLLLFMLCVLMYVLLRRNKQE